MAELTKQEVLAQSLKDYRNSPIPPMTDGGMCLNSEGKKVGCNSLNQPVVNAPAKEVLSQDKEDNFYRSLGFTTSGMIKPKVKGRLLVAVVLVAGYFAYKKYKK
jgi:hypothetical protein